MQPRTDRPTIPDSYGVPRSLEGVLPWSWARERLEGAIGYWLVTVAGDGRAHVTPTWGAWTGERFYCEGSSDTAYARNIARDPRVTIHLESVDQVVIVEGTARLLDELDEALSASVAAGFAKYRTATNYEADPALWPGGMWQVTPRVARGWARLDQATRWHF